MNPNDTSTTITPQEQLHTEAPIDQAPPFAMPIDDTVLLSIVKTKIKDAEAFAEDKLKLKARRKTNEEFYLGKQLDESQLFAWQIPYKDNLIWQNLEIRLAIAVGKMPDIIATPPDDDPKSKKRAADIEKALEIKVKSTMTRNLLKAGLRHRELYLLGCVKCRWDAQKGKHGDYTYDLVRPDRLVIDPTATIPYDGFTSDNMEFIGEWIEEPVGVVLAKFPNKRNELMQELGIIRGTDRQMITKIRYLEFWFTWYDKTGQCMEGVGWKYNDLILDKRKNPYYDIEGYQYATGKPDDNGDPLIETVYRNHFECPRKPYIFITYQNLGKSVYDDTSSVEQAIPLQKMINKGGRQITEIAERAVPKLAFAGKYITKEDARRTTNDPDEHLWFEEADDINQAVKEIPAAPPAPVLLANQQHNQAQLDSKFSTHSVTRGETTPSESGVSKQITREGDLTVADDLNATAVERAMFEIANWATQMMRVMYHEPHTITNSGKDKNLERVTIHRDMIDPGLGITVSSSAVDKDERRAQALDLAARKAIDPMTLFEDLEAPNPKERAERLMLFLTGQTDNYARYLDNIGSDINTPPAQNGDQGGGSNGSQPGGGQQQALLDIQTLEAGQTPHPQQVDEDYLQTFLQYVNSPQFGQEPPQVQAHIKDYVSSLEQQANNMLNPNVVSNGQPNEMPPGGIPNAPQTG